MWEIGGNIGGREGQVADFEHLLDGCDSGDGFLGELAETIGDRAEEALADVDGASAHAGDDAGVLGAGAGEPGKDEVVARPARAAENAEDFNVHGLGGGAGEDGPGGGG